MRNYTVWLDIELSYAGRTFSSSYELGLKEPIEEFKYFSGVSLE